ncbi:MAG: hypothetical protein WC955_11915 [Elusimicrobiota bacterium]
MKNNGKDYVFKDVEFMSADEKSKVLKDWDKFWEEITNSYDKTYTDKYGNTLPLPFSKFTDKLYQHLHLHCSFIAHYDRHGFYSTYFESPEDTVKFVKQFDVDLGCVSIEYGGSYWLNGDYSDLNNAMCEVMNKYKTVLYEKLCSQQKQEELLQAQQLAAKWGYAVKEVSVKG